MVNWVIWRGRRLNQRTINAVLAAEQILGFQVRITQGSYNVGGVKASAGTHDGGGALDISVTDPKTGQLFPKVRRERIRDAFRQVGGAAWIRNPAQSNPPWPWHIHVIMQGDRDLSAGAAKQVTAYRNNKNGLASGARDDGPRTWVNVNFDAYLKAHPLPKPKPPATNKPPVTTDTEDVFDMSVTLTELRNLFAEFMGPGSGDNDHDEQVLAWQTAAQAYATVRFQELAAAQIPKNEAFTTVKNEVFQLLRPLWVS